DREHPRLGRRDRRQLPEWCDRPVVIDVDAVQERRAGPAGTHRLELDPRRFHGLVHVLARVLEEFVDHVVTSVPTRSPETIRLMFESSAMLKTWMLRWFSMQSVSAVRSITLRLRSSASRAVISGMKTASGSVRGSAE